MTQGDEEIVRGLRSEDAEDSVRTLLHVHGGGIYGLALRRLGDPGLAEEVVQEVMVRAWRGASQYSSRRGPLRSWLYEIATNVVIDAHRRRSARPAVSGAALAEVPTAEEPIEDELLRWQVGSMLAELRPEHREVIQLVHFEGLKLREVADRLKIPLGTVKSRCFYALESLRLALEEQGALE